jgi:hypothetical protein
MSQQAATISDLPMAFEVAKAMQADGLGWGEGDRSFAGRALAEIIEGRMTAAVGRHLDALNAEDAAERRNGCYRQRLLTELGDIELQVARTRRRSPAEVIRADARRTGEIGRVILVGSHSSTCRAARCARRCGPAGVPAERLPRHPGAAPPGARDRD